MTNVKACSVIMVSGVIKGSGTRHFPHQSFSPACPTPGPWSTPVQRYTIHRSNEQLFLNPHIFAFPMSPLPQPNSETLVALLIVRKLMFAQKDSLQDALNICTVSRYPCYSLKSSSQLKINILWIHEVTWPTKYVGFLMHMVIFRPISIVKEYGRILTFLTVFPISYCVRNLLFYAILLNVNATSC